MTTDSHQPKNLARLVCRPALPMDTGDVVELTRTIWEGHDYVPRVWSTWLADDKGLLAAAQLGGRVVGLVKLSFLSPGEWWMEGLRVDPAYEGQGIAAHLHEYIIDYWGRSCDGVVRLTTFRPAVIHLCGRTGFHTLRQFTIFSAAALQEGDPPFQPVMPGEIDAALQYGQGNAVAQLSADLMDVGWKFVNPKPALMREVVDQGRAWWWRGREGLLLTRLDSDDEDSSEGPHIQYLACARDALPEILRDVRRLAHRLGYPWCAWVTPLDDSLLSTLIDSGFKRVWDGAVHVFEKAKPPGLP